jgi:hypothetical protein
LRQGLSLHGKGPQCDVNYIPSALQLVGCKTSV